MAARGALARRRAARRRVDQQTYMVARQAVRERANGACEVRIAEDCAGLGNQAHHKLRRSQGGGHTLDNLVWVCEACHTWTHNNVETAYGLDLLRRSQVKVCPCGCAVSDHRDYELWDSIKCRNGCPASLCIEGVDK